MTTGTSDGVGMGHGQMLQLVKTTVDHRHVFTPNRQLPPERTSIYDLNASAERKLQWWNGVGEGSPKLIGAGSIPRVVAESRPPARVRSPLVRCPQGG